MSTVSWAQHMSGGFHPFQIAVLVFHDSGCLIWTVLFANLAVLSCDALSVYISHLLQDLCKPVVDPKIL